MHFTSGARRSLRMPLAAAFAAFIGLVPAVFVATPAYAVGEVDIASDQESVENDAFVFELVRQGGSDSKLDLTYTTENGTAVAGEDYTAISGATSFPAGSIRATTKKFTVQGLSDALDENDETFSLKFTHMLNGQPVLVDGQPLTVTAQGILDDDDLTPTYSLSVPDPVAENAAVARITATLSPVSGRAVTIPITTSNGTAVQPGDYTTTNNTISIPAGETTGYRDVPVLDDTFDEENVETFSVTGAAGSNGEARTGPVLQVHIEDNDEMPTADVTSPGAVFEGTQIDFTVELSAASNRVVTVVANTETGTASAADFTAITDQLVVFQPGETSKTVSVTTATDLRDELTPEDLKLKLSAPASPTQGYFTPGTMEATGHISDDDDLPVVSMSPSSVSEGNSDIRTDTFTVTLDAASGREVRVGYAVASDTATEGEDFEAVTPGELVFEPGDTTKTFTVNIKGDVKDEPDEDFKVTLSNAAGTATLAPSAVHLVTILDGDATPALATFPDLPMAEGDAAATKSIQVALTNPSSSPITLAVTATPDSAVIAAGGPGTNDFDAPSESVVIPAGQTTAMVTFQVNGDEVYEGAETATIKVATMPNDPAVVAGDRTSTLTLTNDDDAPVVELHAQTGRAEGQTATITATVTGVSQDPIAITPAVAAEAPPNDDPAEPGDFDATNLLAASSLPGGTISNPWTVGTVSLVDDTADENPETVKVSMTGLPDIAPVWLTINDDPDDMAPTVVAAGVQKSESDGAVQVPVTLEFGQNGNQAGSTERTITAAYATEDGTAKQPGDYTAASGTVEFEPGDTSESIPVTVNEDTTFERSELFKVKLSSPSPSDVPVAPASVDVGIADNDSGQEPVLDGLVAPVVAFREGTEGTADFTVELDRVTAEDVDVKVTVTDVTATHGVMGAGKNDFEVPVSPVTVPAGETSVVVPITINSDEVYELTETATVGVELAPGETDAVNAPQPVSATLTIVDDDAQPTVVLNTVDGAEGGTVAVTATMTGVSQDPIAITPAAAGDVHEGSHQADPEDFTATFTATQLPAGVVGGPVALGSILLNDDTFDEYDQTVKVSLTGLTSTTVPAWVTIADAAGDKAPTVVAAGVQVAENVGTAQVPVTLDFGQNGNQAGTTERTITAGYTTEDGTAKQPGDYTAATGAVEFEPGDTSESIPVTIKTDGVYERSEAFAVNLSTPSPSEAPIAPASVTVQISDVDSASKPVVHQLATDATQVKEGVTATVDFTVQLDRPASEDVDVAVTVTPGTATHQSNLSGKNDFDDPASPVTVPAGETSVVVPITINNDEVYELTEAATVTVAVASGETDAVDAQSPVTATLTIVDDDAAPTVTALSGISSAAEGSSQITVQAAMTGVAQDPYPITLTAAGTANSGGSDPAEPGDFDRTALVTSLPAGLHAATVSLGTITVLDDKADEWDETIRVSLTGAGTPAPSWLTITDDPDDLPPAVVIADPSQPVGESAGAALVPVTLDFGGSEDADSTQKTVTVKYATANATAGAPGDYVAAETGASVSFTPGVTATTISVTIAPDQVFERTEDFTVTITEPAPTGVELGNDVATVTIADDDSVRKPTFSVADVPFTEGATGGNAVFTVTLSKVTTQAVDFDVTVVDDTATHGQNMTGPGQNDYTEPSATVTVPAGSDHVTISVPVANDTAYEGEESATLTVERASDEDDASGSADSSDLVITDNDAKPSVELTATSGTEGSDLTIRAVITGVAQRDFPFDLTLAAYDTDDVNPAESVDYTDNGISGVIPGGYNPTKPLPLGTVTLDQDQIDEPAEFFQITATDHDDPDRYVSSVYKINDDQNDLPPSIAIDEVTTIDEGLDSVDVRVALSFDSDATSTEQDLSVAWKTNDGTAKAGYDYSTQNDVLDFPSGVTEAMVSVPIEDDGVEEPTQSFTITLFNAMPKGIVIDEGTGQVQINDDDNAVAPTLLTNPANSRPGAGLVTVYGQTREGAQVRIYAAAPSTPTKWFSAATTTADIEGQYSVAVPFDMGYWLQARVIGSGNSTPKLVKVSLLPTFTATSTVAGTVNFAVGSSPKLNGLAVTIQRQNANGSWSTVARGVTSGTARTYAFRLTGQKSRTNMTFRAVIADNAAYGVTTGTSTSRVVTIR